VPFNRCDVPIVGAVCVAGILLVAVHKEGQMGRTLFGEKGTIQRGCAVKRDEEII